MANTRRSKKLRSLNGKGRTRRLGISKKHANFIGVPSENYAVKRYRKTPRHITNQQGQTQPIQQGGQQTQQTQPKVYGKITADWCGHCQSLAPEWEKVKTKLPEYTDFSIKEPELDEKKAEFERKYKVSLPDINGFPTIFKLDHSNKIVTYSGARDAESIVNWVKM